MCCNVYECLLRTDRSSKNYCADIMEVEKRQDCRRRVVGCGVWGVARCSGRLFLPDGRLTKCSYRYSCRTKCTARSAPARHPLPLTNKEAALPSLLLDTTPSFHRPLSTFSSTAEQSHQHYMYKRRGHLLVFFLLTNSRPIRSNAFIYLGFDL